jgi:twinkle protein
VFFGGQSVVICTRGYCFPLAGEASIVFPARVRRQYRAPLHSPIYMDSASINQLLLQRFQEVCQYLLPNGKVSGSHYLIGDLEGTAGASLQITLTGSAAGRFKDFNGGDAKGATPLYLWHKVKKIPFRQAVAEAKEWLGVKDEDFGIKRHKAKDWATPSAADKSGLAPIEPNTKVMDYLILERKLDPIVVSNAKIAESKDGEWIVFQYFDPGAEEPCHLKKLKVDRENGKKAMGATKGTKRGLYGKHMISEEEREITITEGEIDALSWQSLGVPAVSVPNGVADFEWVDVDWDWLERFERINVCYDMDEPGKMAAQEMCKRLGLHRCYIVSLPKKDTNDCLVSGIPREEMMKCLSTAKAIELDEIKRACDYTSEVCQYYSTDFSKQGWETPWYPALPWRLRKAEFTILSGFSGHGKTIALNQLMLHLAQQGCRVMDSSLEIKPGMTLYNMTRCALAKKTASEQEIAACHEWLNDSIFFHDCIGTVNVPRLMHAMEYARKRHGIDVFVIDSLFKCGLSSEDYGSQREFADKLTTFCNNTGAHVILVAHARKVSSGNEYAVPTKADVAGSSDLTNAAFNVIIWWRNKLKKRKLDEARQCNPPNLEEIEKWISEPDGKAVVDKQRFGEGEEAEVFMFFGGDTFQFHTCTNKKTPYFILK